MPPIGPQKLAALPKNIQSQNSKATFKQNLTCINCLPEPIYKERFSVGQPVIKTKLNLVKQCTATVWKHP